MTTETLVLWDDALLRYDLGNHPLDPVRVELTIALAREFGVLDRPGVTVIRMIVVGGVIPSQDFAALREAGAEAIFPPGTVIAEAAQDLLERLNERLGYRQRAPA